MSDIFLQKQGKCARIMEKLTKKFIRCNKNIYLCINRVKGVK
ncbi:hypothetical protein ROSEINA2194_03038 [Roseburia inulinivorans DSM 16841]|uniref:Uncharacterized protein n=1 Tax=Roseburia inulinivorans DSM 16841 TaxID=622312 RepID=C0FWB1_9FIRM|nr:hypothetical protein ROSEINA2194_03038 [Roseburia inulinivorans DSM 16841]